MGITLHQILTFGKLGGRIYCRPHTDGFGTMNQTKIRPIGNRIVRPIAVQDDNNFNLVLGGVK